MVGKLIEHIYINYSNQLQINSIILIQSNSLFNKLLSYYKKNENLHFDDVCYFFENEKNNKYFELFSKRWKITCKLYSLNCKDLKLF